MKGVMKKTVRLVREADARAVLAIYSPVVRETAVSFELEPPSLAVFRTRIASVSENYPWLVAATDDTIAGYAYATSFRSRPAYRWSVETSVYVAAQFREQGVAGTLYRSLIATLRLLRYHNIYAAITLPNEASIKLHENLGFERIGIFKSAGYKFARWHDVGWWQLQLDDESAAPAPPLRPHDLMQTDTWRQALTHGITEA